MSTIKVLRRGTAAWFGKTENDIAVYIRDLREAGQFPRGTTGPKGSAAITEAHAVAMVLANMYPDGPKAAVAKVVALMGLPWCREKTLKITTSPSGSVMETGETLTAGVSPAAAAAAFAPFATGRRFGQWLTASVVEARRDGVAGRGPIVPTGISIGLANGQLFGALHVERRRDDAIVDLTVWFENPAAEVKSRGTIGLTEVSRIDYAIIGELARLFGPLTATGGGHRLGAGSVKDAVAVAPDFEIAIAALAKFPAMTRDARRS